MDEKAIPNNKELFKKYKKNPSNELRNQIFEENYGLVLKAASRIFLQYNSEIKRINPTLQKEDIESFAAEALIKAIEGFNPDRGNKFSTYAISVMENEVRRILYSQEKLIKVPANSAIRNNEFNKRSKELVEQSIIYLDAPLKNSDGEEDRILDLIEDENAIFFDNILKEELQGALLEIIRDDKILSEKEQNVLYKRFFDRMTLSEVGEALHMRPERVRQIEAKALSKLRRAIGALIYPQMKEVKESVAKNKDLFIDYLK